MNRALALVRPVSMNNDQASDWVAAALGECMDMSDAMFASRIDRARKECSYHGQIVSSMHRETPENAEFYRKMDALSNRFLADHKPRRRIADNSESEKLIKAAANGCKP